jgi:hypothetical protein
MLYCFSTHFSLHHHPRREWPETARDPTTGVGCHGLGGDEYALRQQLLQPAVSPQVCTQSISDIRFVPISSNLIPIFRFRFGIFWWQPLDVLSKNTCCSGWIVQPSNGSFLQCWDMGKRETVACQFQIPLGYSVTCFFPCQMQNPEQMSCLTSASFIVNNMCSASPYFRGDRCKIEMKWSPSQCLRMHDSLGTTNTIEINSANKYIISVHDIVKWDSIAITYLNNYYPVIKSWFFSLNIL